MNSRWPTLCGLLLLGCATPEPPPWRLMELGTGSLTDALARGEWVLAESEAGQHWVAPDTTLEGRTLVRDLKSLPTLACGDRIRLDPRILPLSLRDEWRWNGKDSLTVLWQCMTQKDLAEHHRQAMGRRPCDAGRVEADWVGLLRQGRPEWRTEGEGRIVPGDSITLTISTQRADGTVIEPDPVVLRYVQGDPDQVVPALAPWLQDAERGMTFALWSPSDKAFGSQAHPDLGLPQHTPLRFEVRVD